MAHIHTTVEGDHHYVQVQGPLLASEVGLLERACGRALERRELRLTVDLDNTRVPAAARVFLRRLHARGAHLTGAGRDSVLGFERHW